MTENKPKTQFKYNPEGDVLVPFEIFAKMEQLLQLAEADGKKTTVTDKFAFFNRQTHEKLSEKRKKKLSDKDLQARYYYNYDLAAMKKSVRQERSDLSAAILELSPQLVGVFHYNIEKGNCIPVQPETNPLAANPAEIEATDELQVTDQKDSES